MNPVTADQAGLGDEPRQRRLGPTLRLLGLVVVLPLLLLALGLWQADRGRAVSAEVEEQRLELSGMLDEVRSLAARDPNAPVRIDATRSVSAAAILPQIEAVVAGLDRDRAVAAGRDGLALATTAGAALALAMGLAGLCLSTLAGALARGSRERLIGAFSLVRRALPVLLAAQIAGLAIATLGAALFEAGGLWFADRMSGNAIKLLMLGVTMAGLAVWAAVLAVKSLPRAFALFTPEPMDVMGRAVAEADAPALWRFVRELARRGEALAPDHVVVGLTEGFFVTSAGIRLRPEDRLLPPGRTLYLPAPWLALLNGREVAAIIGHELAHFSGEDTGYSLRFLPVYAGLERALDALTADDRRAVFVLWPSIALGEHVLRAFDAAVARWSRVREFEADRRGSLVSGPEAAGSALVRSAVLGPVVHGVLERAANAPERAGDDLVAAIAAEAKASPTDVQAHLADQQPHPTDSHPTLGQRLAALGLDPAPALLDRATRPAGADEAALGPAFFADWPGLCRTLSGDLLARLREHDEAWQDELERAAAAMPEGEAALTENVRPAVVLATVGAPLLAIAAAVVFVAPELVYLDGERFFRAVTGGCLAIGAAMLAGFGWTSHRRGRAPFLVLTPAELRSPHLRAPVPWADVADAGLAVDQNTFMLTLAMEHDAPLPQKTRRRARARVDRKARQVVLFSWRPRDLTPDDYAELVARYLHGARARALLSTRRAA